MLQLGIIGMGRIGRVHAKNITQLVQGARVAAVSDPVYETGLKEWLNKIGIERLYKDYHQILKDPMIDAVLICTPTPMHAGISLEAIRYNKHVFCEKPVAYTLEEVKEIEKKLENTGLKYQVGFMKRFDHNYKKMADQMNAGRIGVPWTLKITSRDPDLPPISYIESSGGIFFDMMIHDFDLARYFLPGDAEEVTALGTCLIDRQVEEAGDSDIAVVTIRMQNGSVAVLENARQCAYGYDQRVEVFGSKGMVCTGNDYEHADILVTRQGTLRENPEGFFLERYRNAYIAEIVSFIEAVEKDTPVATGIYDALQNQKLAMAASISRRERRSVSLKEIEIS